MVDNIRVVVNGVSMLLELMLVFLSTEVARSEAGVAIALIQTAANVLTLMDVLLDFAMLSALHRLKTVAGSEEALNLGVVAVVVDRLDHLRVIVLVPRVVELICITSDSFVRPAFRLRHNLTQLEVKFILFDIEVVSWLGDSLGSWGFLNRSGLLLLEFVRFDGSLETE